MSCKCDNTTNTNKSNADIKFSDINYSNIDYSDKYSENKLNQLISNATDSVLCNPECQQAREAASLLKIYNEAQSNLSSAPTEFYNAQKNYLTFTEGTAAYDEFIVAQYTKEAEDRINKYKNAIKDDIKEIKTYISAYDTLAFNLKNVVELFLTYAKENAYLYHKLKIKVGDVLTNERKTYYENENIGRLNFIYYFIFASIYGIFIIRFIVLFFTTPSQIDWKYKIAIFVLLIFIPFAATWVLGGFIYIVYKIYNILPKNVYLEQTSSPPPVSPPTISAPFHI
jgi:hypothetical protein